VKEVLFLEEKRMGKFASSSFFYRELARSRTRKSSFYLDENLCTPIVYHWIKIQREDLSLSLI